ncbi:MAG: anaerobic C4-dicarboxylate transporter [Bacteroidales bacterium]|nr:anaerobic C4-dicarboxylate transporter [Bacteroidales bacterium]
MMFIVQLFIVLAALYVGSRFGSLALGAISGIALAILVFGFGLQPGTPPTDVIYIIIAAVTCAGMLHAAGGMDWMIQLAEKLLRRHPSHITFLAPFCTFLLTVLVGTGHVVYTLMPIIVDVSIKNGIRPERPCGVASVASQVGITCSPIAAAVVSFVMISSGYGYDVSILQVVAITIPASLAGLFAASLFSAHRGKDLDKDPEFQKKIADPEQRAFIYGNSSSLLGSEISKSAKRSVFIFVGAILSIVILAASGFKAVPMNVIIQIIMLVAAAAMIVFCKASPRKAVAGTVWQSGMVAVIAIYGIAWMADTFFSNYTELFKTALGGFVEQYPWAIAFVFFAVSALTNTQGGTVVAMLPLAYSLGVPGYVLVGLLPSVYGYFVIPNYPSDIATVNFDRTGTTRIGKYLLNHSFIIPGLISVSVACGVGLLLSGIFLK